MSDYSQMLGLIMIILAIILMILAFSLYCCSIHKLYKKEEEQKIEILTPRDESIVIVYIDGKVISV